LHEGLFSIQVEFRLIVGALACVYERVPNSAAGKFGTTASQILVGTLAAIGPRQPEK